MKGRLKTSPPPPAVFSGLFELHHLLNHSCNPNCAVSSMGEHVKVSSVTSGINLHLYLEAYLMGALNLVGPRIHKKMTTDMEKMKNNEGRNPYLLITNAQ